MYQTIRAVDLIITLAVRGSLSFENNCQKIVAIELYVKSPMEDSWTGSILGGAIFISIAGPKAVEADEGADFVEF